MNRIVSRLALIVTGAALVPTVCAATINGKVVDIVNHPVTGAIVTISEAAPRGVAPAMHGASTQTTADGSFSFENLEAGTYLVCSQVPRVRSSIHANGPRRCRW